MKMKQQKELTVKEGKIAFIQRQINAIKENHKEELGEKERQIDFKRKEITAIKEGFKERDEVASRMQSAGGTTGIPRYYYT